MKGQISTKRIRAHLVTLKENDTLFGPKAIIYNGNKTKGR